MCLELSRADYCIGSEAWPELSDLVRSVCSPLRSLTAGLHALRQFILSQGWRIHMQHQHWAVLDLHHAGFLVPSLSKLLTGWACGLLQPGPLGGYVHLLSSIEETPQIPSSCVTVPAWEYFCVKGGNGTSSQTRPTPGRLTFERR